MLADLTTHMARLSGITILSSALFACSDGIHCPGNNGEQGWDKRSHVCDELPPKTAQSGPYWYKVNESSETVVVFVHGMFGNNRDTWLYADRSNNAKSNYWPAMVFDDAETFSRPSIFLAGYNTDPGSGEYSLTDISKDLYTALNSRESTNQRVLDKRNILFVAHSTGGVVVRHMLLHHKDAFRHKAVGLVLMASPSYGSRLANKLGWVAAIFNNRLAKELQWGSSSIVDLDSSFKDFVQDRDLSNLECVEAIENHFIIHSSWIPVSLDASVVDRSSASRYCKYKVIADTDHSSIVKPSDTSARSHQFLVGFYKDAFQRLTMGASRTNWTILLVASADQHRSVKTTKQIYVLANFTGSPLASIRFPTWDMASIEKFRASSRKLSMLEHDEVHAALQVRSNTIDQASDRFSQAYNQYQVKGSQLGHVEYAKGHEAVSDGPIRLLGDRALRIEDQSGGFKPISPMLSDQEVVVVLVEIEYTQKFGMTKFGITHRYPISHCLLLVNADDPTLIIDENSVGVQHQSEGKRPLIYKDKHNILADLTYVPEESTVRILWKWLQQ